MHFLIEPFVFSNSNIADSHPPEACRCSYMPCQEMLSSQPIGHSGGILGLTLGCRGLCYPGSNISTSHLKETSKQLHEPCRCGQTCYAIKRCAAHFATSSRAAPVEACQAAAACALSQESLQLCSNLLLLNLQGLTSEPRTSLMHEPCRCSLV